MNKYKAFCQELISSGMSTGLMKIIAESLKDDSSRYPPSEKIVEWLNETDYDNIYDHIVRRTVDWVYDNSNSLST